MFSHFISIWKQSLMIRRLLKCQVCLTVATTLSLTPKCEIQPFVFPVLRCSCRTCLLYLNFTKKLNVPNCWLHFAILLQHCARPCCWMSDFRSFHWAQQELFSQILMAAAASLLTKALLRRWLHKGVSPALPRSRVPGRLWVRGRGPQRLSIL